MTQTTFTTNITGTDGSPTGIEAPADAIAALGSKKNPAVKIHLPGYVDRRPDHPFQNLEKRYFEVGDLGFRAWRAFGGVVGLCICNDRRWPETYRVMALQGAEMIFCGYNTPIHYVPDTSQNSLAGFHNALVMQAGAYQNGMWVVAVAKAAEASGVATRPIADLEAYRQSLTRFVTHTGMFMRPVFAAARAALGVATAAYANKFPKKNEQAHL